MSKQVNKFSENKKLLQWKKAGRPAETAHIQTARGLKTDNIHVMAKKLVHPS